MPRNFRPLLACEGVRALRVTRASGYATDIPAVSDPEFAEVRRPDARKD